jgi:hypothetical protein
MYSDTGKASICKKREGRQIREERERAIMAVLAFGGVGQGRARANSDDSKTTWSSFLVYVLCVLSNNKF